MSQNEIAPWKLYVTAITETLICFCLTTFCLGIYFTHHNGNWLVDVLMVVLYFLSFGICVKRIIDKFSLAALMLIIPIAPLMILIIVVSMLPLLQRLL